ncbi:UBXN6 [Cordylochernes scorpioides]|uniref:UBXN6 n=1 Tax=Cordylochernes scorpioides TaxID=51811 RepID=A0ABY6LF34_9ARAC|nr:UBXN6 [Cordylochernes scorpioides]
MKKNHSSPRFQSSKKSKSSGVSKKWGPGHRLSDSPPVSSGRQPGSSSKTDRLPQLEAALARFQMSQKAQNVDWNALRLKAKAAKEEEEAASPASEGHPMVKGVYFKCDLLGPDVGPYDQIIEQLAEYLYSQMSEDPVTASVLLLLSCNDVSRVRQGVETLSRCLNNILDNPEEEKYRKLRVLNRTFQERLAELDGALEFLDAVGFRRMDLENAEGEEEPFLVFVQDDIEKLSWPLEVLTTTEPIVPQLDRNVQVLAPAVAATRLELPDNFFKLSLDEARREQALKKRRAELLSQMRTSAQRERDEIPELPRSYGYTVIRVRLPQDVVLQGTFAAVERLQDVEEMVRGQLQDPGVAFALRGPAGEKLEESATLEALRLVPAAVLNLQLLTSAQVQLSPAAWSQLQVPLSGK